MKHNKTVFLLPIIISVTVVLILFSCYPGMNPKNGDDTPVLLGERLVINEPTSIVMAVEDVYDRLVVRLTKNGNTIDSSNVTYHTSNVYVATVDADGTITGVAPGDATITITSESGESSTVFLVHVRDIKILSSSKKIAAGHNLQMEAVLVPGEETLTSETKWSIIDRSIPLGNASIGLKTGLLTVNQEAIGGDVDVIVSSTFGDIVTKPYPVDIIESSELMVTLDQSSKIMAVDEELTLKATIWEGSNSYDATPNDVTWKSNGDKATVSDNGVVKVILTGDTTITVTSKTDLNATAEFIVHARELTVGPEDAQIKLSLLDSLLGGLLDNVVGGSITLTATLTGGTASVVPSTVKWEIIDNNTLSLLSNVVIDDDSGVLSVEGSLGGLLGITSIGNVTVQASIPGTKLKDTKDVPVVSLL